ncbi:DUF1292 domain-containing protein [Anaeromicrobium sediminis]|uniref:DUF1292 domain-containing protein n=1 Tax=Anaeromicrobium sediminis TaxID=1478221 RepID=A0A267MJK1_9FIRM|nr:DUF1292 domain-containing protein [Anaeromicrobium sediminis]PAB59749.1 hypothetical protein CCE28_09290 [Anaeromicrobium sediminis]
MDNNNKADVIYIEDKDGDDLPCEILAQFEMEGKSYVALLPQGQEEEVYLFGYKETGDRAELSEIKSNDEYESVSEAFFTLY